MNFLTNEIHFRFRVEKPFSFERTFYKPSHFKTGIELYIKEGYFVAMPFSGKTLGIHYSMSNSELLVKVYSSKPLSEAFKDNLHKELAHRLGVGLQASAFCKTYKSDKWLKSILIRNRGKKIVSIYSLYENLIISTFLQNATVERTTAMCANMLDAYGQKIAFGGVELRSLWDPVRFDATENDLRQLKVGYRAKSILRITEYFKNRSQIEEQLRALTTPALEKALMEIYGVGKQTVFYTMLGQFHRTEYLKHIPLWELKILSQYLFEKELCDERQVVDWFRGRYGQWCGFALSLVMEDVFYQHQKSRIEWLSKLLRK